MTEQEWIAQIEVALSPAQRAELQEAQAAYDAAQGRLQALQSALAAHLASDAEADPVAWAGEQHRLQGGVGVIEKIVADRLAALKAAQAAVTQQRAKRAGHLDRELVSAQRAEAGRLLLRKEELRREIAALDRLESPAMIELTTQRAALHRAVVTMGCGMDDGLPVA